MIEFPIGDLQSPICKSKMLFRNESKSFLQSKSKIERPRMRCIVLHNFLALLAVVALASLCNGSNKILGNAGIFNNRRDVPESFSAQVAPIEFVDVITTGDVNVTEVHLEDQARERFGGPCRFAVRYPVDIDVFASGTWEWIDPDKWLWRLNVVSPGAKSLSLGFTAYQMPAGGKLFVYSTDGSKVLGPYTERDTASHKQLWTPLIYSDNVVVELDVPADALENLKLTLGAINHGYRDVKPSIEKSFGESGRCNVNVACPEGDSWADQIRSVALYHVTRADGTVFGTGALMNDTAQDNKPYFLTAFHCLDEYDDDYLADPNGVAASMVVYWNFQAGTCNPDYSSPDVPKVIADNATTRSTLIISEAGTITDLNVKLNITHSFDADLDVFLIAPDGTQVELFTDVGGPGDNFTNIILDDDATTAVDLGKAPFRGAYSPEGRLSNLNGKSITGTWTLVIIDDEAGFSGTLNSWSLINLPASQAQTGAFFRAGYQPSDFCLVELDETPPPLSNVYFAGWERTNSAPSSGVAIHHPEGDIKKISFENQPLVITSFFEILVPGDGTHLRVIDWDVGTTEPGSSGCPLFNEDKRIVGQLHGGDAACFNNESDWFGRFFYSWTGGSSPPTRLSDWLDPLGTGQTTLDGKNPAPAANEYLSSDVPKIIADNATTSSALVIWQAGTIADLNVRLNIKHSNDADLEVFLIAPDGTQVELFANVGGYGDNFSNTILDDEAATAINLGKAPFKGSYSPKNNLSIFDGKSITGTWTLVITDAKVGGAGTLDSWSLIVEN